jgi:hypothetical protein
MGRGTRRESRAGESERYGGEVEEVIIWPPSSGCLATCLGQRSRLAAGVKTP